MNHASDFVLIGSAGVLFCTLQLYRIWMNRDQRPTATLLDDAAGTVGLAGFPVAVMLIGVSHRAAAAATFVGLCGGAALTLAAFIIGRRDRRPGSTRRRRIWSPAAVVVAWVIFSTVTLPFLAMPYLLWCTSRYPGYAQRWNPEPLAAINVAVIAAGAAGLYWRQRRKIAGQRDRGAVLASVGGGPVPRTN